MKVPYFNRPIKPKRSGLVGRYLSLCILATSLLFTGCKEDVPVKEEDEPVLAVDWEAGEVFHDENSYTECVVGDMPLVISVPHGGTLKPVEIPDRDCEGAVTVRDMNTIELARAIEEELVTKYQVRPYLVIANLARSKVDQNRDLEEGTCGNAEGEQAWTNFHAYLDTAVRTASEREGRVLHIDLHGHGHAEQRLELGYALSSTDLGKIILGDDLDALAKKSSINNLLESNADLDFKNLITGDPAFGTLMENEGIRAVPSKQDPHPDGKPYFTGGYNTRYYTSSDYPQSFGWQIECNYSGVRDTEASRKAFAVAFAKVIVQYLDYIDN